MYAFILFNLNAKKDIAVLFIKTQKALRGLTCSTLEQIKVFFQF